MITYDNNMDTNMYDYLKKCCMDTVTVFIEKLARNLRKYNFQD